MSGEQLQFEGGGFEIPNLEQSPEVLFKSLKSPLWSENKAKLIARYLYYFVQITHHGTYIDGFAGPQAPDAPDTWSAKLVIESRPRWLRKFFLFDIDPAKITALQKVIGDQPPRDAAKSEPKREFLVECGDFNEKIATVLKSRSVPDTQAAFCLLDQRTFECHWKTVEALAAYKQTGNKIELYYFLAQSWLDRAFSALKNEEQAGRWWGRDDWRQLDKLNSLDRALLFCDRLKGLDYRYVHPWPIYEREGGNGRIMYHMIHATDHQEAPKLMARAYNRALEIPESPEQLKLIFDEYGIVIDPIQST
jgi:three-Cys-motif partner protein